MVKKYEVKDYIGKKFGKWTIIEDLGKDNCNIKRVKCRCECGRESSIQFNCLIHGHTISCNSCARTKHGDNKKRLYQTYYNMKKRCYDTKYSKYKDYGGRGITICNEWNNSYIVFKQWAITHGYREDLTIDRIDVNGNYCPENCRWVDRHIQNANKRKQPNNTSGYTGVYYLKQKNLIKRWESRIQVNYKDVKLGIYMTQKEALEARNKYIIDNGLDYPIQEYKGEISSLE